MEKVKLSADILEKNGFEAIYDDKSAFKWNTDPTVGYGMRKTIIIDFQQPKASIVANNENRCRYEGQIIYLQDLLDLIRICDIDKEIVYE